MINSRKIFRNIGYMLLTLVFLFPMGIPAFIANYFEGIIGSEFADCEGKFCLEYPNFFGWYLVLGTYIIFFLILYALRFGIHKKILNLPVASTIFIILIGGFVWGLVFFGNDSNHSPLRCAIVRDGLGYPNKTDCYYFLGVGFKKGYPASESYCSKIPREQRRNDCYERVSFLKRNPDLCNLIQNESRRQTCLINNNKFFIERRCDNIKSDQAAKDKCYFDAAKQEKNRDLTLCRRITDLQTKKDCYMQILTYGGSWFSCSELGDSNLISSCNNIVNKSRELIKSCYSLSDEIQKNSCYENAVESAKEPVSSISTWETLISNSPDNVNYLLKYPKNFSSLFSSDGVILYYPSIGIGADFILYLNCSDKSQASSSGASSQMLLIDGVNYCFTKSVSPSDSLKYNSYSFIKKIGLEYVEVQIMATYPSLKAKEKTEPQIIEWSKKIAATLSLVATSPQ